MKCHRYQLLTGTVDAPPEPVIEEQALWPKRCACGRSWSRRSWGELPRLADWHYEEGDVHLQLRTCSCGSTMSVPVAPVREPADSKADS